MKTKNETRTWAVLTKEWKYFNPWTNTYETWNKGRRVRITNRRYFNEKGEFVLEHFWGYNDHEKIEAEFFAKNN